MSSTTLIDHYNSNHEEYKQKLLEKLEHDQRNGNSSFLDTIEELRQEQRRRLAQIEHDYYNQNVNTSFNGTTTQEKDQSATLVTSKPPLPKASKQYPSTVLHTEERAQYHVHHRPNSINVIRRHDDEIAFCPHRTSIGNMTTTVHDLTTEHVKKQIQSMWKEFELEDYLDDRKNRHSTTAASWAGRITIPEPFSLTNSMNMDSVHRRKCIPQFEAEKLQKAVDEELSSVQRPFKAKPVPSHVHMPLYERLQDEQRLRSDQVRQMTREYLMSTQKPFGFDAREKAKQIFRRHSYSAGDFLHPEPQFKARPLPTFYSKQNQENELMKEQTLYRSLRKQMRAKELLRQSRLPFSSTKSKRTRRSMSVNNLAYQNLEEYSFKPKTNGYYVPNYDRIHSKFLRSMEQTKRTRSPTKCQPFLLYTNLIPSKKDKILDDIRHDAELRHSKTFQIKGKQMPIKSASIANLSSSLQQSEAIPTKTTEAQRLREAVGLKKRREHEGKIKFEETMQRSKSAKARRVREKIEERARLHDQAIVYKAKRDENTRQKRQSMRQSEDDYARKLEEINQRLQHRPLLLEHDTRQKAVRELEKKIQYAMNIAQVTDEDLIRQHQTNKD